MGGGRVSCCCLTRKAAGGKKCTHATRKSVALDVEQIDEGVAWQTINSTTQAGEY